MNEQSTNSILRDVIPTSVNVLIQDPHTLIRDCLKLVVEELEGAKVVAEARSPGEALETARLVSPDIVILDLDDWQTAVPVIEALTAESPDTRVICLADNGPAYAIEAALKAGATGLALKSESVEDLLRAFSAVRGGSSMVAPNATGPLLENYLEIIQEKHSRDAAIIQTLASALDAKDHYTGGHTQRVASLAVKICSALDPALGSNAQLRYGFVLHDVGKIGIHEEILLKPTKLTKDEWSVMKTHPVMGVQIISPVGLGDEVEDVVRHHHEQWNGKGYPDGLGGTDIPRGARIFTIADSFDAMTSDRPYRATLPSATAIEEIRNEAGRQFDSECVEAFMEVVAVGNGR